MTADAIAGPANRTVRLFPWYKFLQSLVFYQAIWFLFFQTELSAAEAILLYVIYDIATTVLEVPSGYLSDRVGRRITLVLSGVAGTIAGVLLATADVFWVFALGQVFLGLCMAFSSGTDSAILYESLTDAGRADEVEAEELRAWRYGFVALALSAVTGGLIAIYSFEWTFWATALGYAGSILVAIAMCEPTHQAEDMPKGGEWARLKSLRVAMANPVLIWLFVLGMLMYAYSHVPFVFGQPFILEALRSVGLEGDAPLISGAVTSIMMMVSVAVSLLAPQMRQAMGLGGILLLAFGIQVALAGALSVINSLGAIGLLFLRMVPDSLSRAFILARIQPELESDSRATYLSVRSLAARLFFAVTLMVAAGNASAVGEMAFSEIRMITAGYAVVGIVALVALWVAAKRLPLDQNH